MLYRIGTNSKANCRQMVFLQKEGTVRRQLRERCADTRNDVAQARKRVHGECDLDVQLYVSKRKREENVTRLDSCVTPVVIHHVTPAGERPPSGYYRNKCARLHNTTTSNSGRFDGARYRPLGEWAIEGGRSGRGEGEAKAMALCSLRGGGRKGKERERHEGSEGWCLLPLSLSPLGNRLYNLCLRMANTERRDYHGTLHLRCQVDLLSIRINDVYARITIGLIYIVRNLLGIVLIVRMIDGTLR